MNYENRTKKELIVELLRVKKELDSYKEPAVNEGIELKQLQQRIKEIKCHNAITELLTGSALDPDEILNRIVRIIPDAMQFPDIAEAMILVRGKTFKTSGYKKSKVRQTQDIKIDGKVIGRVEVCYPGKKIPVAESLFLQEESDLLLSITDRIGNYLGLVEKSLELTERKEQYRKIIENINDVIYEYDINGIITYISPVVKKIYGFSAAELIGKSIIQFVAREDKYFQNFIKALIKNGEIHTEYQIKDKAGEIHWAIFSTKAVFDGDRFTGGNGILTDITKRKLAEIEREKVVKELRKSKESYRNLVENLNDVIYEVNSEGIITYISPLVNHLFGYSDKEIEGKSFSLFFGEKNAVELFKRLKILPENKAIWKEYLVKSKSGEARWIRLSTKAVFEDGTFKGGTGTLIDITDKKLTELKLQKSEALYRTVLRASPDAVVVANMDGIITFASPVTNKILEADGAYTFIGHQIFEFLSEEEHERANKNIKRLFNGEKVGAIEYKALKSDGRKFYVEVNTDYIRDNRHNPVSMLIIVRDITDRKESEERLRKSQDQYKLMIDTINEAIFEISAGGAIEYVSPAIEKIIGYKPDELTGKNIFAFMHPDDRPVLMNALAQLGNKDFSYLEYRYIHKDGTVHWVRSSTNPLIRDGKVVGGMGSLTDINKRKLAEKKMRQSEEKYRSLIDSSDSTIIMLDAKGTCLYVNNILSAMVCMPSDKMAGMNVSELFSADLLIQLMTDIDLVFSANTGILKEIEAEIDGVLNWFRISIQPVRNESGIPYAVMIVGTNITENKKAEILVRESEKKYKALFLDSPEAYMIMRDGIFIECNTSLTDLIGGDRSRVIGKTVGQISPEFQPNGRRSSEYVKEIIEETFKTGKSSHEWLCKRTDGSVSLAQIHLAIIDYEGEKVIFGVWKDITKQKKEEEDLRKLMKVVDQTPVSIVITDLEGKIEYANPKALETSGYSLEEFTGKNPRVQQPDETDKNKYVNLWETIGSGKVWQGIFHSKKKDGELYWEASTIAPLTDESGKITHYIAIKTDITERIKTEEALAASERRYRQVATHSRSVIWEVDMNGLITYVSPNSEIVYGCKPEELIGKKYYHDLFPENKRAEFRNTALDLIRQVGEIRNFDSTIERTDGNIIWVTTNCSPVFDEDNKIIGYLGSDTDITERKFAEDELRKFKTIVDQANIGNGISDLDGILLYSNEALAKMHGWEVNEILGKPLYILHNEIQMPLVIEKLGLLKSKGEFNAEEVWHTRKDGTVFPSLMNAKIVVDKNNVPRFMTASILDISDVKEAEIAIRQSEENLNYAQEIAGMGSWQLDFATGKTIRSENLYKMFGLPFSREGIPDSFFMNIIHPDDLHIIDEKHKEVRETRRGISADMRLVMQDGTIKWIQNNIVPVFEGETMTGLRGVSIDITGRRESEAVIKKLTLAVEQSPVSVIITGREGNIEYVNPAFVKNTGYASDEVIGRSTRILKAEMVDEADYNGFWREIIANKVWSKELIRKKKNGEYYWEHISTIPIVDESGKIMNLLSVSQDITERKENEKKILDLNANLEKKIQERTSELAIANKTLVKEIDVRRKAEEALLEKTTELENFFNVTIDLLCIADMEGNFLKVNKAWEELLGCPASALEKVKFLDFVHPEDLQTTFAELAKLSAQNPVFNFTNRYRTPDGNYRYIEWRCTPVGNRFYSAARDVTEHRQVLEELQAARLEAEQANKAKSEFLANMSHEIRTPMNAILGYSELLDNLVRDKIQKDFLNSIKSSGRSLLTLINDILDLSKIEAGKMELEFDYIETGMFFGEFEKIFSFKLIEKGLRFNTEIASGTPAYLYLDGPRLRQVILNIVGNAVKFTQKGAIGINVMSENPRVADYSDVRKKELIDIVIEISDTGIGIPKEFFSDIFESFVQVKSKKKQVGTGLSLAITRRLVQLMNGDITVRSELGEGSTFIIKIPDVPFLRSYENLRTFVEINPDDLIFEEATILVVDDVDENRKYIKDALRDREFRLIEAASGIFALEIMDKTIPDLIITDIRMPEMDGFELLSKIKSSPKLKHIPVIAYSASVMKDQREKIHHSEFVELLIKPVQISELYLALMNNLPYKTKKEVSKEISEIIESPEEQITDYEGLKTELYGKFSQICDSFSTRQPIGEIKNFGRDLVNLGRKHTCGKIIKYGEDLLTAAESFNIEGILRLIRNYKIFIESIKN